jgi:hypothetical protein
MSRAQLTSTDQQNSGGPVSPYVAGKNAIINGGMDIWQRSTSLSFAASTGVSLNTYTADRWQCTGTNVNQALTISRQPTGDSTNLPNIQYCLRYQRNSGQTGGGYTGVTQSLETINSIPFAGKIVTMSFYVRAGANYSTVGNAVFMQLKYGTGTDQNVNAPFTGDSAPVNGAVYLTTTWQRFSFSILIPANATQLATNFIANFAGTAGAADYFELTGVQLEIGSAPTPFSRAGGTIQGELAACQRYYYRQTSVSAYGWMAYGGCQTTTNGQANLVLPVQMRVVPTALEYANVRVTDSSYAGTLTSLVLQIGESTPNSADVYVVATGLTGGRPLYIGANNNTGAYLAVTAEL